MSDRIRAALEAKPQHLWDLLKSLNKKPPHIAGPWVPTGTHTMFRVGRKSTSGYELVEIYRDLPNTGHWMLKFNSPKFRDGGQSELDKLSDKLSDKLTNESPLGFDTLRARIDEILEDAGWVVLPSKFPGTSFAPWQSTGEEGVTQRPFFTQGTNLGFFIAPTVRPRVPDDDKDKMKAEYTLTLPNGFVVTHKAWNIRTAQSWADDLLVGTGFDLAQPGAHDLTQMRRDYDIRARKQKREAEATPEGMEAV